MDNIPDPATPASPKSGGLIFVTCVIVGVLLCFETAIIWSHGELTGEAMGYAFGNMLFPGLIAYAIAGRRKVRSPAKFGLWFCGLCLLSYLLEWSHHIRS
jgi:hypothetical protein